MPSRSAVSFAGGATVLRPRPRGASGRVRSDADLVALGEPLEHVGSERRRRRDGELHLAQNEARPQAPSPRAAPRASCGR